MPAIDVVNRIFREFKRYTGDGLPNEPTGAALPIGDPQSGPNNPKKSELREALLAPLTEAEAIRDETEAFRDEAEAFAALSGPTGVYSGTHTGDGATVTFALPVAPSSEAHLWLAISGVLQAPGAYSVDGAAFTCTEAPPEELDDAGDPLANISYRIVSIADGETVPPDLSVTTSKLGSSAVTTGKVADDAITFAKMQNIATARVVGRNTAGTGDAEELDEATFKAMFNIEAPGLKVVDRAFDSLSAHTTITSAIPLDDTIPQNTEGNEVLDVTITPKSVTNRLRARVSLVGTVGSNSQSWLAALFMSGTVSALAGRYIGVNTANTEDTMAFEWEWVPGVTTPLVISVRAGPSSGATLYLNGNSGGRVLGGAQKCTLVVEELEA